MAFMAYERSYGTARGVFAILEFVGWISVIIGVLTALIGFWLGGFLTSVAGISSFGAKIIAMVPGMFIAVFGLISVAFVQSSRANVDSAEMTREMLEIARKQAAQAKSASAAS